MSLGGNAQTLIVPLRLGNNEFRGIVHLWRRETPDLQVATLARDIALSSQMGSPQTGISQVGQTSHATLFLVEAELVVEVPSGAGMEVLDSPQAI